jgi:tRNA threonylcarbamoyladenosine biosynthesis protein TsaE
MSLIRFRPTFALTAAALMLALAGADRPAVAHPHVWVTDVTTFVFEGPRLIGLRHHWQFDELFSSYVIEEHDADGDGAFDPAELAGLQEGAFSNLAEYGYFTHARVDRDRLPLTVVQNFQATVEDGLLIYEFTLPLPEPIDPAAVSFAVGVYDAEYYVEVLLDPHGPGRFSGMDSGACIYDIRADTENPIYYGMVNPLVISLQCVVS